MTRPAADSPRDPDASVPQPEPWAGGGIRLTLLAGFKVEVGGQEIPLRPTAQHVVAYLAVAGRPSRSGTAGRLWPDQPEPQALNSLRSALHRLKRSCSGLVLRTGGMLCLNPLVQVDVHEVTQWARRMLSGADTGVVAPPAGVALDEELLPGWYDDWVCLERERLQQLRMHALESWAEHLLRAGRFGEALYAAYSVMRMEPLRESANRLVVRAHLAEGNAVEALRRYESYRAMLAGELGLEPSAQMTALVRTLCRIADSGLARRHRKDGRLPA
ncbi:BTAD domain-containing putative transcriptional regulator [Micromonospora sp. NPDC006766]|uniref:AfsR/SARP family transcriptional regulator n=1 Tax=Micromonospora sp. NPDC006766 TaxID=3154778 RepID=UPI0033FE6F56